MGILSAEYSLYSRQWTNNFICIVRSNFIDIDSSSIQSFTHSEKLHVKRDLSDFQIPSNFSAAKLSKKRYKRSANTLSYVPFWHRVHSTEGIILTCSSLCSSKKFIIALKVLGHKNYSKKYITSYQILQYLYTANLCLLVETCFWILLTYLKWDSQLKFCVEDFYKCVLWEPVIIPCSACSPVFSDYPYLRFPAVWLQVSVVLIL